MIKNIEIPFHLRKGTKKMSRGLAENINIIAIDTETVNGEPWTIQIATKDTSEIFFVNKKNVTEIFFTEIEKRIKKDSFNIIYGHNLQFDLAIIFYPYQAEFINESFEVKTSKAYATVYTGKIFFAEIYFGNIKVLFYDTYRFVMTSLDKACQDLQLPIQKLTKPEGLGDKKLRSKEFREYALNDARIQYILSEWIIDRCREYDVPVPISVAQFAQYVFRKNFLPTGASLTFPPCEAVNMALLSYHGGRNGCYIDTPCLIKDVKSYDIISAYPYAMSILPSFLGGCYKRVEKFSDKYVGIYQVTGKYKPCHYGLLYNHKFNRIYDNKIIDTCLTSYEIKEALDMGELKINKIEGWIFIPDAETENPLREYVKHFFDLKQKAQTITQRWIAKVCLNSLYGKFIQTNEPIVSEKLIVDYEKQFIKIEDTRYKAGGMFNPFIASLITSHTRVYCHQLEHKYNALHTATDSIFTKESDVKTSAELGGLKYEGTGDLLLLRNKFYIHFDKTPEDLKIETNKQNGIPYVASGIRKYALHGFHARITHLLDLWKQRKNSYIYKKMTLIKESIIHKNMGYKANMINEYQSKLDIDWNRYYEI